MQSFAPRLLAWFDQHGRHDLPWQQPREPYRVWLAEIMLQQTQVATVIPYFTRFIARFPDVRALAAAEPDAVLALWAGLGYYARARNLHRCAQEIVAKHHAKFPTDLDALMELPGIGRSTAGAILAQAHGLRLPILDGNVRRVLARHGAIAGWPGAPAVQKKLWRLADQLLPEGPLARRMADYTQAIMDLGATVCTARKPACGICPLREDCAARLQDRAHELPAPKPRRARPHRRAHLLIIESRDGAVLLERRPPAGIWGGLWCLPMYAEDEDWRSLATQRYGFEFGPATPLPVVQHGFTHFDLDILPLRLRARAPARVADEDMDVRGRATHGAVAEGGAVAWIKMSTELPVGVPAPVKKLLQPREQSLSELTCPEPFTASS